MNEHLSPQQMLAYIDGELSRVEVRRAAKHLHSCWTCMAEMERMKDDIATILEAHEKVFVPGLPPAPRPWPGFNTILARDISSRSQSISLWMHVGMYLNWLLGSVRLVGLSAIFLVLLSYFVFHTRTVSAKEVLARVHVADAQRDAIKKDQVIRQRIHIRKISHGDSHSTFDQIDAWKSQTAGYWNVSEQDAAAAELEAEYQKHNIATGLPLSTASVDSWVREAGDSPTVSEHGTDVSLNYGGSSKGATDSLEQVNIVVQQSTWQIKKMTLDFHDVSFEVMADDYSILPKREVPTALLAHLELYAAPSLNPGSVMSHSLTNSASNVIHLPMLNLDKTELDVFTTLHGLGADLGEPVTVTHSSEAVLVGLWQLPGDRQAELRAALVGKPGVHVLLTEPHAPLRRVLVASPASDAPQAQVVTGSEDQSLIKYFGSLQREQGFSNEVLGESTVILSRLYALRNLQKQFPTIRNQSLGPEEQLQLRALVRDHTAAISQNLDALEKTLAPINASFGVSPCVTSVSLEKTDWQSEALTALDTAKGVDHILRMLFTANQTPASPDSALPGIAQNLCRLCAQLKSVSLPDIH
jgi:hypothetical protein